MGLKMKWTHVSTGALVLGVESLAYIASFVPLSGSFSLDARS